MRIETRPDKFLRTRPLLPGALFLAFLLVASLWARSYFGAEARVRRATAKLVRTVEKSGPEAPMALGLSANRLGGYLATNAVLELEGYGPLASGRKEIVQFYAQVRSELDRMEFAKPRIAAVVLRRGAVNSFVEARYRLVHETEGVWEGDGRATLLWIRGEEGWRISRAELKPDESAALPKGWP